ncbi:MAG: TetR/AcrR family transcriptional regulator [Candidatus Dadabacteria bacterium]|nr:TetR/AcrR family transcriptional regulator [Candidatus Dadabacteria bacterium]
MESKGRVNQRARTRNDILLAAARLLGEGRSPTMEDVAAEAMVSRATAYRYFPSMEALLVEAPIHGKVPDPGEIFAGGQPEGPEDRADAAEAALHDMVYANELQLRALMLNSLKLSLADGAGGVPVRQSRRMGFIEAALEPARAKLGKRGYKRLSAALCLFFGPEAMVVFKDVLPLGKEEARKVKSWGVRALVRAALDAPENGTQPEKGKGKKNGKRK